MKSRNGGLAARWAAVVAGAAFCVAAGPAAAAPGVGETAGDAVKAAAADTATSPVEWAKRPWGEMGVARMLAAPFPDDSRTTGYQTDSEFFAREGHYDDNRAAIAIPDGFKPSASPDFVVICHGHRNRCTRFLEENRIGEVLQRSGRNAILVVPQGPADAPDSGGGKFEKPGGFGAFVAELTAVLVRERRLPSGARPGRIILGGYSGGYRPVAGALERGGITDSITEVWLVDAAYNCQAELARPFADAKRGRVLRSIFTEHLARENLDIMMRVCSAGRRIAVVDDEALTSAAAGARKAPAPGPPTAAEALGAMLDGQPVLFIRTTLPHDAYKLTERYLGEFLRRSPNLKPRADAS